MNLSQNVVVALRALAANKLRSVLTMLGIIIGVAAVVALIALGNGATAEITNQIESVGSNLVIIIPGSQEVDGEFIFTPLFLDDYETLESQLHNISAIVPMQSVSARLTPDDVVAGSAPNIIVSAATVQVVITVVAVEEVISCAAVKCVVAGTT